MVLRQTSAGRLSLVMNSKPIYVNQLLGLQYPFKENVGISKNTKV